MAKRTRHAAHASAQRTVKTSLVIDAHLHSRLSALASLRGCTINALMIEGALEVARGIAVVDRRKVSNDGDMSGQLKGSADDGERP